MKHTFAKELPVHVQNYFLSKRSHALRSTLRAADSHPEVSRRWVDVPITSPDGLFAGKVYALTLRLWNREIAETDQDWLLYAPLP